MTSTSLLLSQGHSLVGTIRRLGLSHRGDGGGGDGGGDDGGGGYGDGGVGVG